MTPHEIVALRCPSCGGGIIQPSREMPFGAEFRCDRCGITSVLIINRALLPVDALQKSGDQVCAVCGRVAKLDARFCQDGHKLVRTCLNDDCHKEFAAYHQRCDYCGWPQDVKPGTTEAYELELDLAIADLSDVVSSNADLSGDHKYDVKRALSKILDRLEVGGRGKRVVVSMVSLLHVTTLQDDEAELAWRILAAMRGDAVEAASLLLQRVKDNSQNFWNMGNYNCFSFCKVLAMIAPQEVLPLCRNVIEASGKTPEGYNETLLKSALATATFVGKPAIPMLLEFCGSFSGRRGTACQETVNEISEKGRKTWKTAPGNKDWVRD